MRPTDPDDRDSDDGKPAQQDAAPGRAGMAGGVRRPTWWSWRRAAQGFILGFLIWLAVRQVAAAAVSLLAPDELVWVAAVAGAVAAQGRTRRLLWSAGALVVTATAVIGFSPLAGSLVNGLVRDDSPQPAPAVVVLASDTDSGLDISQHGQARLLRAYELLKAGYSDRLVLSRGSGRWPSWEPAVRAQMRRLGIEAPVEVTGPVANTHGEALAVTALARTRGWPRVLLVTDPWHMRRAAALFHKTGLPVVCAPCVDRDFNLSHPNSLRARLTAFNDWLHEAIGLWVYRRRGWV